MEDGNGLGSPERRPGERLAQRWINIYDEENLAYWERRLKASTEEIIRAVRSVSANPIEVKKWLRTTIGDPS